MVVCKEWLERLKTSKTLARDALAAKAAIEADITRILSGKSYDQLVLLQRTIQTKLGSGEPIDVDYWEGLLKSLLVWKAKVLALVSSRSVLVSHSLSSPSSRLYTKLLCAID